MEYHIWTDGSCLENNSTTGGPGGYSIVAKYGEVETEISKGFFKTTNNRMEVMAIIVALSEIQEPSVVKIYTDSQYAIDGVTKWIYGWLKNNWKRFDQFSKKSVDVKNKDLFIKLHRLVNYHKVQLIKVKGHSGVPENERCDVLAKEAAANPTDHDEGFIPKWNPL